MKSRLILLVLVLAAAAAAQSSNGYLFVAPGGLTCCGSTITTLHIGGGGEGIIGKGFGVGAEIGALGPTQDLASSIGAFSANGYFHFIRDTDRKFDPFVTGGYTLLFRGGTANAGNFGGGVNYWFSRHFGVRLEFRDHVYSSDHYWGFRFGVAFR